MKENPDGEMLLAAMFTYLLRAVIIGACVLGAGSLIAWFVYPPSRPFIINIFKGSE